MENAKVSKSNRSDIRPEPFKALFKGLIAACAITALVFAVYAILLTYTDVTEKNINLVVMLTVVVSVFIAGFNAARGADKKGWLWGMGAGLLYMVIMVFIKICAAPDLSFDSKTAMHLILSIAGGGLGGITGINVKR